LSGDVPMKLDTTQLQVPKDEYTND